jgi:hypothetical protein
MRVGILTRSVSEDPVPLTLPLLTLTRSVSEDPVPLAIPSLALRVTAEEMSWRVGERTSRRCQTRWRTS